MYVGRKDAHRLPVCLFTREQAVTHLPPGASKINGLDKKKKKMGGERHETIVLGSL